MDPIYAIWIVLICQTISGFYLLAKVEEAADKTIYNWTHQIVSGHTLKHLCAAMVPVFLALMLAKRTTEPERLASRLLVEEQTLIGPSIGMCIFFCCIHIAILVAAIGLTHVNLLHRLHHGYASPVVTFKYLHLFTCGDFFLLLKFCHAG